MQQSLCVNKPIHVLCLTSEFHWLAKAWHTGRVNESLLLPRRAGLLWMQRQSCLFSCKQQCTSQIFKLSICSSRTAWRQHGCTHTVSCYKVGWPSDKLCSNDRSLIKIFHNYKTSKSVCDCHSTRASVFDAHCIVQVLLYWWGINIITRDAP